MWVNLNCFRLGLWFCVIVEISRVATDSGFGAKTTAEMSRGGCVLVMCIEFEFERVGGGRCPERDSHNQIIINAFALFCFFVVFQLNKLNWNWIEAVGGWLFHASALTTVKIAHSINPTRYPTKSHTPFFGGNKGQEQKH